MKTAIFIGRFQPFHLGHLKVIKWILREYDKIIIVIGSSQESNTKKNPFNLKQRKKMIKNTLKNENIENYKIIDFPDVNDDKKWVENILKRAKFDMVFTGNPWTKRCFKPYDIPVKQHPQFGNISGNKIREMMKKNKEWEKLVPSEVVKIIKGKDT